MSDPARQAVLDWIRTEEARERKRELGQVLFAEAFERFLSEKQVRDVTLAAYKLDLERVYKPAFGGATNVDVLHAT